MSLKGKVALVTGSTSGIGLGIAEALAEAGADIMLNGFGAAAVIENAQGEIARRGVRVAYCGADVGKPQQVADMVAETIEGLGGIDIVVNNAGIQHVAPIETFPDEQWDRIIAINLSSAFHATKAAIPAMRRAGWGRIINIASAHGLVASAQKSAYVAAKHGIVGLTKVTALELAASGITANAICPGWVLTPLVQTQLEARARQEGHEVEAVKTAFLTDKQAMAEFSTPQQIGSLTAYLCSDAARTITGTTLSIDGGWTAH